MANKPKQSTVPNLDALDAAALREWAHEHFSPTRVEAAKLIPDKRKLYTRIVRDLACYADNLATSIECRERGDLEAAGMYAGFAKNIYNRIPADLRWK